MRNFLGVVRKGNAKLTGVNHLGKEQMSGSATIWNLTKRCEILMGLHENGRCLRVIALRRSDLYHSHWHLSGRCPQMIHLVLVVCMGVHFWVLELIREMTWMELKSGRGH